MAKRVLVVEDEGIVAITLKRRLESWGYEVDIVVSGEEAIEKCPEFMPNLVLMDINLQGNIDGVDATTTIKANINTPVIYMTAYSDDATLQRAKITEPHGYILKPFDERELRVLIEMSLYKYQTELELHRYRHELEELVAERTYDLQEANQQLQVEIAEREKTEALLAKSNEKLAQAYDETLVGWSRALELRDKETEGHSERVTRLTVCLAEAMGLSGDDVTHLRRGALLHDIGKMGVPDTILLKSGPLTDEEWRIMQQHPVHAYKMLYSITYLKPALDIPYCHHEKWDGTGYPRGLKGQEIPLAARIFAVVDVWDALSNDRPYHRAWPKEKTLNHIRAQAGKHFDPQVVGAFMKIIETWTD